MRFSRVIDSTHLFVPKTELTEDLEVLRARFTIKPRFENLSPVPIYRETATHFGFPRHWRDFHPESAVYENRRSQGSPISFSMVYPPRPRQAPLLELFDKALLLGSTGFLLQAPTGSGKTYLMLAMLSKLQRTALIVVPREHIVTQWVERICEHTSLPKEAIGIVQQNRCEYEGKALAVGMIHSLVKDKYPESFKKWPGVVVIDEVHVTGAETFSRVVAMFPSLYRIGASATPERPDGMDPVFRLSIGETIIRMPGTTDVLPRVAMIEYDGSRTTRSEKLSFVQEAIFRRGVLISALSEDFARNVLLASYVHRTAKSDRRTLLLSDRKEQLAVLKDILVQRYGWNSNEVGIFIQETPDAARKHILTNVPIILATYGMMNMAVDVPDLSGLVFGTPQSHVTQAVGRILRQCDGKKQPVVVDIVDTAFRETVRWALKRKRLYAELGADVYYLKAQTAPATTYAGKPAMELGFSR